MTKYCVNCSSSKITEVINTKRPKMEGIEGYEFVDIQYKCPKCGYDFNSVGSKEINTS